MASTWSSRWATPTSGLPRSSAKRAVSISSSATQATGPASVERPTAEGDDLAAVERDDAVVRVSSSHRAAPVAATSVVQ